jgi:hypothetical protein
VVLSADATKATPKKGTKSDAVRVLVDIIAEFAVDTIRPWPDSPSMKVADIETVRAEFYRRWTGDMDAKKHAYNRAVNNRNFIGQRDGKCWLL